MGVGGGSFPQSASRDDEGMGETVCFAVRICMRRNGSVWIKVSLLGGKQVRSHRFRREIIPPRTSTPLAHWLRSGTKMMLQLLVAQLL